jgi:NAD(P)-dependent dehydrogenase (short-subunit alcohol dehydrogenase family)
MNTDERANPVWLITGCSTGLGRALAERVLKHGHRCVATARAPEQILDLLRAYPETSMALALDVTDDKQRRDAVARAEEAFGGIDVLVNNAGHGYSAAIEEGEERDIRAMFDTTFFGLAAMTRPAAMRALQFAGCDRSRAVNFGFDGAQ